MPCSAARLAANRANAARSTGPRTEAGKEASRRNALTHGLTGGGVVVPGEDAAAIARQAARFQAELAGDGSATSMLLARRVALLAVRLERSARHEAAVTADRIRQATADLESDPHDEAQSGTLDPSAAARAGATDRALVGDEPATLLARKYESATERALFRTLREIREFQPPEPALLPRPAVESITPVDPVSISIPISIPDPVPPLGSFFPEAPPTLEPAPAAQPDPSRRSRYAHRTRRPRLPS